MARQTQWWILNLPGDPVQQDVGALKAVADSYRRFAEDAARSASGSSALIADPAIQNWMGASGKAFQSASEPFPGMLDLAKSAYQEAGDAYSALSTRLSGAQDGLDRLCTQALQHYADAMFYAKVPDNVLRDAIQQPNPNAAVARLASVNPLLSGIATPIGLSGASLPMLHTAIGSIYSCRTDAEVLVTEKQNACKDFIDRLQDATILAGRIVRNIGASGKNSLDFATRFAAFGGNPSDLKIDGAGAGADILYAGGMPNDNSSVPPVPSDADAITVAQWWGSLSPEQQDLLVDQHPDLIGSLNGVPCDVRDRANRELLDQKIAQLEADGSNDAQLKVLTDLREKMNQAGQRVYITDNHLPWRPDTPQFDASMPPLYLLHFDTDGNGHLIMAAGNPDAAKNVVTYVPGLGTKLSNHMVDNDIAHTENLYLQSLQGHPDASVSSIFWLGYDAPQIDGGSGGPAHALDVTGNSNANAGAPKLTAFLNGLQATSTEPAGSVHYTALGHSYGSLVVGAAAAAPGGIPVRDIIFVGSPGVGVDNASGLNVGPEHVWAGSAANDPVPKLQTTADGVGTSPLTVLGPVGTIIKGGVDQWISQSGADNHGGWFGMNPATSDFHGNIFSVAPGDTGGVPGGMQAHGEYFDPATRPKPFGGGLSNGESLQSMANIIVGDYDNVHLITPPQTPAPHQDFIEPGPPRTATRPGPWIPGTV